MCPGAFDIKRMIVHSYKLPDSPYLPSRLSPSPVQGLPHAQLPSARRVAIDADRRCPRRFRLRRRRTACRGADAAPGSDGGDAEVQRRHPEPRAHRPGHPLADRRGAPPGHRHRPPAAVHRRRQRPRRAGAVPDRRHRLPCRPQRRSRAGGARAGGAGHRQPEGGALRRTGEDPGDQQAGQRQCAGRAAAGAGRTARGPGGCPGRQRAAGLHPRQRAHQRQDRPLGGDCRRTGERRPARRAGHHPAAGPDVRRPDPVQRRVAAAAPRSRGRQPGQHGRGAGGHRAGGRQPLRPRRKDELRRNHGGSDHRQLRRARGGAQSRSAAVARHVRARRARQRRAAQRAVWCRSRA